MQLLNNSRRSQLNAKFAKLVFNRQYNDGSVAVTKSSAGLPILITAVWRNHGSNLSKKIRTDESYMKRHGYDYTG